MLVLPGHLLPSHSEDICVMSGRTVEGQRPEVDTYRTQISCPNCVEKARGLHHIPTPPNQTLHPSQWAVLKRDPPLGVTALLFTKPWDRWGEEMTKTVFQLIKGKTKETHEVEQKKLMTMLVLSQQSMLGHYPHKRKPLGLRCTWRGERLRWRYEIEK